MFDVAPFALSDMLAASAGLRRAGDGATSMEQAADQIVRYLHTSLVDKRSGDRACALVRFYKSHRYSALDPDLQAAARNSLPADASQDVHWDAANCLTLLATAGSAPGWDDRHNSVGHRAIPLLGSAAIERLPMISALVSQLGIDPEHLADPDPSLFTALEERSYNVFHVAEAAGSPFVPAQHDFVERYGIASVIGCGGVLPSGELFATILFTTVPVPRSTAEQFASLALSIKVAILPFVDGPVFSGDEEPTAHRAPAGERRLRSRSAALSELLEVRDASIQEQATRLETALRSAEERADALAASQRALLISEARHHALVESSIDAIVSMDTEGRITEINPSAEVIFGYPRSKALGQCMADLLIPDRYRDRHRAGLAEYLRSGHGPILGRHVELTALRADGTEFPVELTVTALAIEGQPPAFTAYVRDISARRESERARLTAQRHTAHVARTLQASLLPPVLPQIPGTQVAARYVPAGGGGEIGGDFYDVFETAPDDWAVILGDVCGKGPEAAAVTALARYTTRAAAMRDREPSSVLAVLNEALMSQFPERFLTAVYVRVRLTPDGLHCTLSVGGHPLPVLIEGDGRCSTVGEASLIVGAFPHPEYTDVSFDLPRGHTLVLYTDGVTEARSGSDFFDEERLHQILSAGASKSVSAMVAGLADAVRAFEDGEASDDVAILAIRALPL
ncbi:MAG: hypothetical protein NVS3B12_11190 [Acidimicrobiales bacterium]